MSTSTTQPIGVMLPWLMTQHPTCDSLSKATLVVESIVESSQQEDRHGGSSG